MNSFQEVFARVKQYCLEEGDIPEVAIFGSMPWNPLL